MHSLHVHRPIITIALVVSVIINAAKLSAVSSLMAAKQIASNQ